MYIGDWLTLGIAAVFVGFLMYWRVKIWREYVPAPKQKHRPTPGPIEGPDKEKLINIGTVAADGSHSK